ncbi:uncharacterized [Tachysurus ichikawai]
MEGVGSKPCDWLKALGLIPTDGPGCHGDKELSIIKAAALRGSLLHAVYPLVPASAAGELQAELVLWHSSPGSSLTPRQAFQHSKPIRL